MSQADIKTNSRILSQIVRERKLIEAKLKDREEWFRSLIINSNDIIAVLTSQGDITYESPSIENILGYKAEERVGLNIFKRPIVHPEDLQKLHGLLRKVVKNQEEVIKGELRFQAKNGEWKYLEASLRNKLRDSKIAGIIVNFREVTERKLHEQKISFLADAGKLLSSSLDYKTILRNLAKNAVPAIADWCIIRMLDEKGDLVTLEIAHKDFSKRDLAFKLVNKYKDKSGKNDSFKVIKTGVSEMIEKMPPPEALVSKFKLDPEMQKILKELNLCSYMIVPIKIGRKSIGVITLATDDSRREYTKNDLVLAEELAARAALAIENSQLFNKVQTAVKLRDDFINIASHELRTPVTSIKAYSQLLNKKLEKNSDKSLFQLSKNINNQLTRLTELIGSLLDATRIQSGKLTINEEKFHTAEFLKKIIIDFRNTNPEFKFNFKGANIATISGDRYRLEQVMVNLISNAIKYSKDAKKQIDISLKKSGKYVIISVKDYGIGIAPQNLERIFDRFFSIDSPLRKQAKFSSLGLGLWICMQIVDRHSGEIWVESKKGAGATFYVKLPLAK